MRQSRRKELVLRLHQDVEKVKSSAVKQEKRDAGSRSEGPPGKKGPHMYGTTLVACGYASRFPIRGCSRIHLKDWSQEVHVRINWNNSNPHVSGTTLDQHGHANLTKHRGTDRILAHHFEKNCTHNLEKAKEK